MRRLTVILVSLLSVALIAAGCGDDDDDAPAAPAEPAAQPAEEPAEEPMAEPMEEPAEEPMEEGGTIAFSFGNEQVGIYKIVAGPARLQAEIRGYEFLEGAANGD